MLSTKKINLKALLLLSLTSYALQAKDEGDQTNKTASKHEQANETVVTVSGQAVMQQSKIGEEIQDLLKEEQEKLAGKLKADQEVIIRKSNEFKKKTDEFQKKATEVEKSTLLSEDAKDKKRKELKEEARQLEEERAEIERLDKRLQADMKALDAEMNEFYQKELAKLDGKIKEVISKSAKEHGWKVVLMEEQVIFSSVSVTDIIIKELDKQHSPRKKAQLTSPADSKDSITKSKL